MSNEIDHEDWLELRARVDSIANAIFVLSGGAIALSVPAILKLKASGKTEILESVGSMPTYAWFILLGSMMAFVLLKVHLVAQAYSRTSESKFYSNVKITNIVGWSVGVIGLVLFMIGMFLIVCSAANATGA